MLYNFTLSNNIITYKCFYIIYVNAKTAMTKMNKGIAQH